MGKNAVKYAEENLGVHVVWDEAQTRLEQHDDAKNTYLTALRSVRDVKEKMRAREMTIVSDERGKFPDMKVTPFRDHIKAEFEADVVLSALRDELAGHESDRDRAKADMDHHSLGVQATTARMSELAGLLNFYSAAKAAETANK
jgi:hypothetical protein